MKGAKRPLTRKPPPSPWPPSHLRLPDDEVLERLDQVLVVPMPKRAQVVTTLVEPCL